MRKRAVWAPLLLQGLGAAESLLSALSDDHGRLLWADRGMSHLADACGLAAEPAALLVNPDLNRLLAAQVSLGPVFEGILTVGDGYRINRALRATAWRLAQGVLLFAEPNARELGQANAELSRLTPKLRLLTTTACA